LINKLKDNHFSFGYYANDIIRKNTFTVVLEEKEIQLIKISVAELGFKIGATYRNLCLRAKEIGLTLCPSEVGPQLRLQYKDQPSGECLNIGMEPILGSNGLVCIFTIKQDGHRSVLGDKSGVSGFFVDSMDYFIFCIS
jgi:hypothetical protein